MVTEWHVTYVTNIDGSDRGDPWQRDKLYLSAVSSDIAHTELWLNKPPSFSISDILVNVSIGVYLAGSVPHQIRTGLLTLHCS